MTTECTGMKHAEHMMQQFPIIDDLQRVFPVSKFTTRMGLAWVSASCSEALCNTPFGTIWAYRPVDAAGRGFAGIGFRYERTQKTIEMLRRSGNANANSVVDGPEGAICMIKTQALDFCARWCVPECRG